MTNKIKLLIISRDCFSKTTANGKTLEALLTSFQPNELIQFYTGIDIPDFDFCNSYFRFTDMQMLKSFFKKQKCVSVERQTSNHNLYAKSYTKSSNLKLWNSIRKLNFNFGIRFIREILWKISPNWKKNFYYWLKTEKPTAILYMVGDSFYLDSLVISISKKLNIPIILFNVEAYRIINCKERNGFDWIYNKKSEKSYKKLQGMSALTIYNCNVLKESYQKFYTLRNENAQIAYNAHIFDVPKYVPQEGKCNIVYFGNLGIGRVGSLIDIADTIKEIAPSIVIDVFGRASDENELLLRNHPNIKFHGSVEQDILLTVKTEADILLQVECFDPKIMKRLKYAFSTKIAQCLCAGRALLSYAPKETASTIYLEEMKAAVIVDSKELLKQELKRLINDPNYRIIFANKALEVAYRNHDAIAISKNVRTFIETTI